MSEKSRIWIKMCLTVIGVAVIGYIFAVSIRINMVKQPEGEYMRLQDGMILAGALDEGMEEKYGGKEGRVESGEGEGNENFGEDEGKGRYIEWQGMLEEDGESYITYGQFNEWLEAEIFRMEDMAGKEDGPGSGAAREGNEEKIENIKNLQKEYKKRYRPEFQLLQIDWYEMYGELLACYGLEDSIRQTNVTVLGCGGEVTDGEGVPLGENSLLAEEGIFFYRSDVFERSKYQGIRVYQKGETLLTVRETVGRGMDLQNIWIMEAWEGKEIQGFYKGYEIRFPYEKAEAGQREQIGDLTFADGILQRVKIKGEKINGKLLSMGDDGMEIEGWGTYPYEEGMAVYRLYGKLSEGSRTDLRIGYDFTDFVLEDGVICAGLVTRDEAMENIRVVIKNTGYEGAYHEKAEFTADTAFTVRYGNYDNMESREYQAGDVVSLEPGSELFSGGRVYIEPAALTGRIKLLSVERAQGNPAYRGKLEIARTDDGLVIVNELLLEEYLYSVVPSEMPASYPLEALKAQAVCARTYAYRHMMHSGIAGFGAHVDDSAGYQVYNNIAENAQTTKAVKETSGSLLYYGDELCGSYYYSTSCGFGTDAGIWKSGSSEDTSYLQARRIGEDETGDTGEAVAEEENFDAFISEAHPSDYESKEAWYRWSYESKEADGKRILSAMQARYEVNENLVLTQQEDGSFESEPVKRLGQIKNISIVKRGNGGVADELLVEGTKNVFKVISEHNIRYVLNNGVSKVVRQDGSEAASPNLLPSGYFSITTSKEEDIVVGYTLSGGGYGHGVGMSQNGAKEMAKKGFSWNDILTFFYQSCEVRNIYSRGQ